MSNTERKRQEQPELYASYLRAYVTSALDVPMDRVEDLLASMGSTPAQDIAVALGVADSLTEQAPLSLKEFAKISGDYQRLVAACE